MEISKRRKITYLFALVFILILVLLIMEVNNYNIKDPEELRKMILSTGGLAPVAYVVLHAIQVFFPVIPGNIFSIVGGYLFGPSLGILYNYIGVMFGTCMAFLLGRKAGEGVLESFVSSKAFKKVEDFFKKKGKSSLFLLRILPVAPNNMVSVYAGTAKIPFWYFFIVTIIGFSPFIILFNLFGAELSKGFDIKFLIILLIILFLLSIIYYAWHLRQRLKK